MWLNRVAPAIVLVVMPLASMARGQCAYGDLDASGDVSLSDVAVFVDCLSGPTGAPLKPGCDRVDFEADGDVDLREFGTFQRIFGPTPDTLLGEPRELVAGWGPEAAAIGDFDVDGDLDLVVPNYRDDNVSVLLNHGDGTFQGAVTFSPGNTPKSLAIGDLDRDGDLELAVVSFANDNILVIPGLCIP